MFIVLCTNEYCKTLKIKSLLAHPIYQLHHAIVWSLKTSKISLLSIGESCRIVAINSLSVYYLPIQFMVVCSLKARKMAITVSADIARSK